MIAVSDMYNFDFGHTICQLPPIKPIDKPTKIYSHVLIVLLEFFVIDKQVQGALLKMSTVVRQIFEGGQFLLGHILFYQL